MSNGESQDREELLASLICQYEQALRAPQADNTVDESALGTDAELLARFDAAKHGLEALEGVRRFWNPHEEPSTSPSQHDTKLPAADTIASSDKTIGRFHVQRELGRGGLGVVFLAMDPSLHRHVALKVPRIEVLVSDEIRERFMREAAAAARLNHPHLVSVYEVGEDGGICYIAAEYCPGITLREWIAERDHRPTPQVAAQIVRDLANGMQHAHGRGVLHRDIKPSNVLVEEKTAGGRAASDNSNAVPTVKLADFGVAKLLEHDGDQTRSGAILGTLAYMAPEQAEGRVGDVDIRSDVYGLGAVLYELLTGQPPFRGDTDAETLRQLLFREVLRPSRVRQDVPRDLEAICLKCLQKDRRRRYNTAQELSDDLNRFLECRATEARPLRPVETLWKWVCRRPATAAIITLLLLCAGTLLGTFVVYNERLQVAATLADASRDRAEQEAEKARRLLYSSDVRLAYETLKANNVVQAIEALDEQIPAPGETDLREFAWNYLRRRCGPDTLDLVGHEGTVFSIVFSPDGRMLATAGLDGTVRLWDAATGQPRGLLRGHTTEVTSVAFAPDGRTLASGSEDYTIRVWDRQTGRGVRVLKGHGDHVQSVAFSRDGRWLASGSRDTTVRVWDAATGDPVVSLDEEMDVIRAVAFSPSGDKLFAADELGRLYAWETERWNRVAARESVDKRRLFTLAVSREGTRVAAAGEPKQIYVWTLESGELSLLERLEGGHSEWVQSLAFSPADDTLPSGGKDGVIRLWRQGDTVPQRTLLGHKGRIWSVAWSPDGKWLASAGANGAAKIWDLDQKPVLGYPALPNQIYTMAVTPDGSCLYTGTLDGFVHVWDPDERTLLKSFLAHSGTVNYLRISPDGSLIASAAKQCGVKIWSQQSLSEIRAIPTAERTSLAWDPTSKRVALCADDTTVAIVDVDSGKTTHRFGHEARVRQIAFTPKSRYLVTTTLASLEIWDVGSQRRVFRLPESHTSIAVASDGQAVAAVKGPRISLIDLSDGFRVSTLVTNGLDASDLAFSPDGNTLAVAIEPRAISVWDRRTGHEMMRLESEAIYVNELEFAPDGRALLAVGKDADGKGGVWEWTIRDPSQ